MKYLGESGLLQRFYFSHKVKLDYGIPKHTAKNMWAKEYMLALHARLLGNRFQAPMLPLYHGLWESAVLKDWIKPDVAHILLHGTALKLIERCRKEGAYVMGEAVNAHQDVVDGILAREYEHLGLKYERLDRTWERLKQEYALSQCILVPSDWVARSFLQAGFHPDKICRLPYPSGSIGNLVGINRVAKVSRNVRVLCVAGILVRKGQHYLMKAARHLNKQNSRVQFDITLVGSVGNRNYLSVLMKMGVPFNYIPHIPNNKMVDFMSRYDVFVLPSLEDGFGVVVSEALEAGMPVVTTQNTGAADSIRNGQNGFVVPPKDSIALADAIADAVDLIPEPGFMAPDQICDWQAYTERLISIYRSGLAQGVRVNEKGAYE